jgi:7-cyano-7-deazaguanine synthase
VKTVVSLSGGLDSAVALANALKSHSPEDVLAVGFGYGSKHGQYEQQASAKVAAYYGVRVKFVNLWGAFYDARSALMQAGGGDIPEGHYEAESMRQTVVPGRNTVFAAVLLGIAQSELEGPRRSVVLGIHAGDHHIYPDCRPAWFVAMAEVYYAASEGQVILNAPLLYDTKVEIVRRGLSLNVPFHLTRTCYKDQEIACGRCGSCQERLAAFKLCGADDPITYVSRELLPKKEM